MKLIYLKTILFLVLISTSPVHGSTTFFAQCFKLPLLGLFSCITGNINQAKRSMTPDFSSSQSQKGRSFFSLLCAPIIGIWSMIRENYLPATRYYKMKRDEDITNLDRDFREQYIQDFTNLKNDLLQKITDLNLQVEQMKNATIHQNNQEMEKISGLGQSLKDASPRMTEHDTKIASIYNRLVETDKKIEEHTQSLVKILDMGKSANDPECILNVHRKLYDAKTMPCCLLTNY